MKFRLTYSGPVKSSGNKPKPQNKHALRLAFHEQLSVLWTAKPVLRDFSEIEAPNLERAISPDYAAIMKEGIAGEIPKKHPYSELLVKNHEEYGVKWHPLITTENGLVCELNILMLRPNDHKSVVQGGDIDGRIKTIFDSLSIPTNGDVLSKFPPTPGVFHILLSDDSLISKVSVDTDELLQRDATHDKHHVQLIIEVSTRRRNEPFIRL